MTSFLNGKNDKEKNVLIEENGMFERLSALMSDHKIDVIGVADVSDWPSPQPECNPNLILRNCARIVVFGKEISRSVYLTQRFSLELYGNVAKNYYQTMDAAAIEAASFLTREGFPSVPLGSYLPLLMRQGKYWGMVSLKHAAVRAGLGSIGKNTLLINERYGNRLRLGGILTTAPLPAGRPLEQPLCIKACRTCIEVCPVFALDGRGGINQYKCLRRSTSHPLLSAAFLSKWFSSSMRINKMFELVTNTLGANYSYSCCECLINCPHFDALPPKEK